MNKSNFKKTQTENPILLTTKISKVNSSLQGMSDDSKLTFRYTDVGDEVSYEERGKGKNKFAKIHSVIRANDYNPLCKHFGDCGGCSAGHINYTRQFQIKTSEVVKKFEVNHGFTPELIPAEQHYHYRNRMDFAVFPDFIGLRQAENFRRIINVEKCELESDWANKELTQLRKLVLEKFPKLPFDRKSGEGFLKYITLRTNLAQTDTVTIFTFVEEFQDSQLEKELLVEVLEFSSAKNILFCYNRKQSEVSADGKFKVVRGKSYYSEIINQKEILVPFNSFFQPNPKGFIPIIRFIEEVLFDSNSNTLIDLFCGNGFFSILFGEKFQTLVGYDWVESSILTATENLKRIYPDKTIQFEKKDLLQFKDVFTNSNQIPKDSILILDPPRNGIGIKLCEYLLESEIDIILYVSCNPNSQLEDLKILSRKYSIQSGLITDPYPHTPHLESVIYLKRLEN